MLFRSKIAEIVTEFKPAYKSAKVYQERILNTKIGRASCRERV